jgi:hypothetical protein
MLGGLSWESALSPLQKNWLNGFSLLPKLLKKGNPSGGISKVFFPDSNSYADHADQEGANQSIFPEFWGLIPGSGLPINRRRPL